jgi:hypothetical protein
VAILPSDSNSSDCTMEECVRQKYLALKQRGYLYPAPGAYVTGPNSNSFAQELLLSCGVTKIMWPTGIPPFTN